MAQYGSEPIWTENDEKEHKKRFNEMLKNLKKQGLRTAKIYD